jgi:penicillin-binding protein 1A
MADKVDKDLWELDKDLGVRPGRRRFVRRRFPRVRFWTVVKAVGQGVYWLILVGTGATFGMVNVLSQNLPDPASLEHYEPSLPTKVYDRNGELITQFQVERRYITPLSQFPEYLLNATVAIEDERFYEHNGVDVRAIIRAAWANLKAMKPVQGGSTITQQLARDLFLSRERTFGRKGREALLAMEIERQYTKDEILYFYLNQTYYGHNAYGAEAAARVYFGKNAKDLTLEEAAMIAGLPRNSSGYSPYVHPVAAKERRDTVLYKMREVGYITEEEYETARSKPVKTAPFEREPSKAPYFAEYVRKELVKRYGSEKVFRGGLQIYTTLDLRLQKMADDAVTWGLDRLDKVVPLAALKYDPNLKLEKLERGQIRFVRVTEMTEAYAECDMGGGITGTIDISPAEWTFPFKPEEKIKVGEEISVKIMSIDKKERTCTLAYEERPFIQASLIAIEPSTGDIVAMVGGSDFSESQFNRSVQSRRQPGSAFKVFVYTAAIDNGFTPADVIIDAPFRIQADGVVWAPHNYSLTTSGEMTIRQAIEQSINIVAAKVIDQVGIETVVDYAHRMGIKSELVPVYSLALGTSDVTVLDMTSAFGTLANFGERVEPRVITKIEDRYGNTIEEFPVDSEVVLPPETCAVMISLLEGVINSGTAAVARRYGFKGDGAGKTGTTEEGADTWFIGFVPSDLSCGVWVGRDDHESLSIRATGEYYAVPIWARFMSAATEGEEDVSFKTGDVKDLTSALICQESGLLATSKCTHVINETFITGTAPTKFCDMHELPPIDKVDTESRYGHPSVPPAEGGIE